MANSKKNGSETETLGEKNKTDGTKFLEDNKKKPE